MDVLKRKRRQEGFTLIETLVAGSFLAVATLGLTGAMISGLTLENRAKRTMSRVATAENMMEEVRAEALTDFNGLVTKHDDTTRGDTQSTGQDFDTKTVRIRIPLDETTVPGAIDLDGNGLVDSVTTEQARVLVLDLAGNDSLRLRTVVHDAAKLGGIGFADTGNSTTAAVAFGEVREGGQTTTTSTTTVTTDPNPNIVAPTSTDVKVTAIAWNGKGLGAVLTNSGSIGKKVVAVRVVPDRDYVFTNNISVYGLQVYKFTGKEKSGPIFIPFSTPVSLSTEAPVAFADFLKWNRDTGQWVAHQPGSVTVTFFLHDGTTATAAISK